MWKRRTDGTRPSSTRWEQEGLGLRKNDALRRYVRLIDLGYAPAYYRGLYAPLYSQTQRSRRDNVSAFRLLLTSHSRSWTAHVQGSSTCVINHTPSGMTITYPLRMGACNAAPHRFTLIRTETLRRVCLSPQPFANVPYALICALCAGDIFPQPAGVHRPSRPQEGFGLPPLYEF